MLNFGNKEFRNLQEQVLFNANELQALKQLQLGGVKIIDLIEHSEDLPVEATAGDAYLVGEGRPYSLYVYIDGDYFDLGDFPLGGPVGPQGIQGIKGEIGQRGSRWSIGTVKPAGLLDDLHIDFNGNIYRFNGNEWQLFTNIRGPQGLQGPVGPVGPQGEQGIQGEKGETGLSTPAVVIRGILTNITQLPSPELVERNRAYIINGHIYVVTGGTVLSWSDAGLISEYTQAHQIAFDDSYGGTFQASDVQTAIEQLDDLKVAKTTTINTKPLSANVELTTDDIHYPGEQETVSDVIDYLEANMVHKSTTINNKPLTGNITLEGSDIMTEGDTIESHIQDLNGLIQGLDSTKAAKATTLAGYGITDAYTKTEVDNRTSAVYRLKGNKTTYTHLPSSGQQIGDVWNVLDTGINYVWNGTAWDDIGGVEALATTLENGLLSRTDFVKLQELDGNLALKADITYVDSEIEALDDKVDLKANNDLLTIENLIPNGDFSNGTTGWIQTPQVNTETEITIITDKLYLYSTGSYTGIRSANDVLILNDVYYTAMTLEFVDGSYKGIGSDSNGFIFTKNGFNSYVGPATNASRTTLEIKRIASNEITEAYIDNVKLYNVSQMKLNGIKDDNGIAFASLTDAQIKSQLDKWVQSGLINSKLEDANQLFAPRKTEEWQDVPLEPGITKIKGLKYRKTFDGTIQLYGDFTIGSVGTVGRLPVGYRPSANTRYPVASGSSIVGLIVQADGYIASTIAGTHNVSIMIQNL